MECYDVIVIGTGGVGSAAMYHLADRGARVLGLDPFPPAHQNGSSHGQTRIIRQAYFEHSDYVPLLLRAYDLWRDVESRCQKQLFHQVGLIEVGPADGVVIPGVLRAAAEHRLPIESLSAREAEARFPQFRIPSGHGVVFEPTAGYLLVEECVMAHLSLAELAGANWRQEGVLHWEPKEDGVFVRTKKGQYFAGRIVIASGAWSGQLIRDLGVPLKVVAKHLYWFDSSGSTRHHGAPTFFFETGDGYFYGFPPFADGGVKIARHSGGTVWDRPQPLVDVKDDADLARVRDFSDCHLRHVGHLIRQQACMYTVSPDEHFIVDRHCDSDRVIFAAGLSGHGFKFTTVLGEILADLALEGGCSLPIEFLRLGRMTNH